MIGLRQSIPQWLRGLPGLFPAPPEELMSQPFDMQIEYISPLALAMKLVGITGIERLASFGGGLAAVYPEIIDKLNWDRMIEVYGDRLSVEPDLIIPQDVVDQRRQQRAAQQQQQQLTEQLPNVAKSAEVLSRTDVNGTSALNRLLAARGVTPNIP